MRSEARFSFPQLCHMFRLGRCSGACVVFIFLPFLILVCFSGDKPVLTGTQVKRSGAISDSPNGWNHITSLATSSEESPRHRYEVADCHVHLVDFLQQTEGINSLLKAMDRTGVKESMISGMPLVVTWTHDAPTRPTYYLDCDTPCYWYSATDVFVARELLKLPATDRSRFYPFICGFNPADRNAVDHIKRMIEWYPGLWKGIGEVMTRHDDLSNLVHGEKGRANHLALDPVYKLAAELNLPVSIHSNISSVWKRDPIYLEELKDALTKHPKTCFIWCHAGISRRIEVPNITEVVSEMLKTHPNLHVDLSWIVYDTHLVKNGKADKAWVKLVNDHPERFMIGSDAVGRFGHYHKEIRRYEVFLDAIEPDTAKKVARDNFLRLMPKQGASLK